jgi:hypothetical protein
MATTYTLISSSTVGSSGSSQVDFTSIPQTYTDLNVLISARNTHNNYYGFYMRFNSNSSGYTSRRLRQSGTTVASDTSTDIHWNPSDFTGSVFSSTSIYIPNYTGSSYKSASIDSVAENNATNNSNSLYAWLWSNTSAITSISFGTFDAGAPDKFAQYSTFYLYGISNA